MSLWKWNDVELEIDMGDVEFQERYENAFKKMEINEKELQKTGTLSGITKGYCQMFWDLFDGIFGDGTAERLFHGRKNTILCEECYDSFLEHCKKEVVEINKKRASRMKKYRVVK